MDLLWWLPAIVLIAGSLLLLARIRVVEREVTSTTQATARLSAVGESGAILAGAVAHTEARRARTSHALTHGSVVGSDRGRSGAER